MERAGPGGIDKVTWIWGSNGFLGGLVSERDSRLFPEAGPLGAQTDRSADCTERCGFVIPFCFAFECVYMKNGESY